MSLHRVDARFLLPAAPRTAVVLGALDGWRDGLATAGIVPPAEGAAPDLVVASADHVVDALSLGGRMLIVEGGDAVRPLRRHGLSIRRYLPRPTVDRPQVVIPIDEPAAARYATAHWTYAASTWKRVRNRLADMAFATRMLGTSKRTVSARRAIFCSDRRRSASRCSCETVAVVVAMIASSAEKPRPAGQGSSE